MTEAKKVALVSGANKGIGLETARQLGKLGMTVLLGARDLEKGQAAAAGLQRDGIDVRPIKFDVLNPADITATVAMVEQEFGVLDVLINNAGVNLEEMSGNTTISGSDSDLRDTFNTNFFAVIAVTNAFLPLLRKSPAARIVNMSSILASLTLHAGKEGLGVMMFAYDASKTALNAYTIHLAKALKGTNIKVNSAHPGWVKTDMGGPGAQMDLCEGAKTGVTLATLPEDGPTGGYFHLGKPLPW